MGVSNIFGSFAFLSIPIIIILYMFRPKHRLQEVPSIFLWQEIMQDLSNAKKFEKLRKTLLFLLDILIALLITFLLLGIFFNSSSPEKHKIVLINGSFSMNAEDVKPSRFEKAKTLAEEYVDKLDEDTKVSLILVKEMPEIISTKEDDKNKIINQIKSLKPSLENTDLGRLNETLTNLKKEESADVIYFTDEAFDYAENVMVSENSDNLAIVNMASKVGDSSINTAVTIENQSDSKKTAQVSLYDNDLYLNTKSVEVEAKSTEVIFFENINKNIGVLKASLDDDDINKLDNVFYDITKAEKKKRIALVSSDNYFLEKFLSLNPAIDVFKIKPEEYTELNNYDAYIFDSYTPETFPNDGNILVIDPSSDSKNEVVKADGYVENPDFKVENHIVNQFLNDKNFNIALSQTFEKSGDREAIYSVGDKYLAFSSSNGLQKIIVFGFDFRYTDLPLKADFPILMNNVIATILDEKMTDKYKYHGGERVKISLKPSTTSASLIKPDGKEIQLKIDKSQTQFKNTDALGLYKIEQRAESEENIILSSAYFAVNPPSAKEKEEIKFQSGNAKISDFKSKKDIDRILITILIILLLLEIAIRIQKSPLKRKKILALRMFIILLIILSIFDLKFSLSSAKTDTFFVADFSESMSDKKSEMNTFISTAIKEADENDLVGVISFAGNSVVEKKLSDKLDFMEINPDVEKGASNIEKGIEMAEILFNEDEKKRIVLLSDGRENAGDLLKKLGDIKEKNIAVDFLPMADDTFSEVEIDEINLPKNAKKGQDIQIEAVINANVDTKAKIYLYNRNNLIEKRDVEINKGRNNYIFSSEVNQTGIMEYKLEIVPEKDKYTENNRLSSFINVDGKLKLLVLQNKTYGENYASIFDDFDVELMDQTLAPESMENLLYYDAFLLADVSLEKVNEKFVDNVATLVKEQAKSLIVSGGENSFALGGYTGTKLEEILPVEMKVKDKDKRENIAMVLVIDRSGSMMGGEYGVSKISLAREAAIRSSEVLEDEDYLGVIAFDSTPKWVEELKHITDKDDYAGKISAIKAMGGTSIQPALESAIDALKKNDAALKHIILLTDGMAEQNGYERYINDLTANKISLSCVAVGDEADKRLLSYLAKNGKGRYYESNVFTDIPTIFAKETVLAGKKYLNNIDFYPKVKSSSRIFSGIDALPELHGFTATTEKPLAKVILTSPDGDPILATYSYGLGKTAAFTSDMHGLWSTDFLEWKENKKFWHNILSELLNQNLSNSIELSSEYRDNMAFLHLEVSESSNIKDKEIKAKVFYDGKSEEISLKLKSPYVYEASFKPKKDGIHMISGSLPIEGEEETFTSAFIIPYSDEFRFFGENALDENDILAMDHIRILEKPEDVFKGEVPEVTTSYNLKKIFLVIALILFLIELTFWMTNLASRWSVLRSKKRKKDKEDKKNKNDRGDKENRNNESNFANKDAGKAEKKKTSSSHIDELLKKY